MQSQEGHETRFVETYCLSWPGLARQACALNAITHMIKLPSADLMSLRWGGLRSCPIINGPLSLLEF